MPAMFYFKRLNYYIKHLDKLQERDTKNEKEPNQCSVPPFISRNFEIFSTANFNALSFGFI